MTNETDTSSNPNIGRAHDDATSHEISSQVHSDSDVNADTLKQMLAKMKDDDVVPDYDSEMGDNTPLQQADVDITLLTSREEPVAGEMWSITGEIFNRSSNTIWIVDKKTTLALAPEMYGHSSQTGSMGAFFPTSARSLKSEVIRIDPGSKYSVIWKLDPLSTKELAGAKQPLRKRITNSIKNFIFFNPGRFHISSTVHIWTTKPSFTEKGDVANLGHSTVRTVSEDIYMHSSPWVLILGAACGGILCFLLQSLLGLNSMSGGFWLSLKTIAVGLSSALILSGVVTVLVSRLASTDFLIVVKVKDFWGAIATGFAVQWFGYPLLEKLLSSGH